MKCVTDISCWSVFHLLVLDGSVEHREVQLYYASYVVEVGWF